jgi:hypothetical protein
MKNQLKPLVFAGAAVVGTATVYVYTRIVERYTQNVMRVQFEHELDMKALAKARDLVIMRVNAGQYHTYDEALRDLDQEIAIQKIAFREG